jgi:hypothetical protein
MQVVQTGAGTGSVHVSEDAGTALLLDAADRLIGDLADAVPALRAVGDALAVLAGGLGVEKVIVAVDDASLGRQVFCSGRVPLGERGIGLRGPQGAWTQPPRALDEVAASVLVRAVAVGVVRSTARSRERALEPRARGSDVSASPDGTATIADAVATATARAVRHGWGFTLVLVRAEEGSQGGANGAGLVAGLKARLRAADLLVTGDGHEVALLLPQTAGDRVPLVLARLAAGARMPPFSYGLACCPADGTDPDALCHTAASRLEEATRAATPS